jgi:hypothetical protein
VHTSDHAGLLTVLAPSVNPAAPVKRVAWIGWATAAALFVALATIALVTMQVGLRGDPRTTDPNLGPFLSVTNWPLVASLMSAILTLTFFGYLMWRSIRARSPHWLLIVGIAAFFAGARPAGELGDLHGVRSAGRAFPAGVALLQYLAAAGTGPFYR